jgi:hypothetical protein
MLLTSSAVLFGFRPFSGLGLIQHPPPDQLPGAEPAHQLSARLLQVTRERELEPLVTL